jgi:AcrR family transcriptional regulator
MAANPRKGDLTVSQPTAPPKAGLSRVPAQPVAVSTTAQETRQKILAAAATNIAELGLARVRMATIAREAGVSTALLHYHFDTKERLFAEVLAYSYERSADLDQEVLNRAGSSLAGRLSAYLDRCLPIDDHLAEDWLLWQELALLCLRQPEIAQLGTELYDRLYRSVVEILEAGVKSGEFHLTTDAHSIAEAAVALCDGLGTRVLTQDPNLTLADARRIIAHTVGALAGHDGPLPVAAS